MGFHYDTIELLHLAFYFSSKRSLVFPTMPVNKRDSVTRFTLLNEQGDALSGFYMEITAPGKACYIDARGTEDEIEFFYDEESRTFDSWHVKSPDNHFCMTPVMVGNDIVGLDIVFSNIDNHVTHFALDIQDDDGSVLIYDVLAPPVYLPELEQVSF